MSVPDPIEQDKPALPEAEIAELAAQRAVEVLIAQGLATEMLTATEVAAKLKVDRAWVYRHSRELGCVRLGDGPNSPLRFPARSVVEFAGAAAPAQPRATESRKPNRARRMRSRKGADRPLLRYRGDGQEP